MSITFSSCFYIIKSKFDPSIYINWMNNFLSIVVKKENKRLLNINSQDKKTYISALFYDEIFDEIMKKKGWVKKDVNEFPEYVDLIFCVSMSMINSNIKNYKDRNKFYNIKAKLGSFFYNEDYENNKYENSIYNKQNLYFNMKKYFPDVAKKYFAETNAR